MNDFNTQLDLICEKMKKGEIPKGNPVHLYEWCAEIKLALEQEHKPIPYFEDVQDFVDWVNGDLTVCPRCQAWDSLRTNGDVTYCSEQCGHVE